MSAHGNRERLVASVNNGVVIVGAGTIGEHLIGHVVLLPGVHRVTLIDQARPAAGARARPSRSGRNSKVEAVARRARRLNPGLEVDAICAPVETVPWGRLRGNVILSTIGSPQARRRLSQAAWRLGVPWIDAGVDAAGEVVHVNAYVPGSDGACLECGWVLGEDPPSGEVLLTAPSPETGHVAEDAASGARGAAAAFAAVECMKLLHHDWERLLDGRQVQIDLRRHTLHARKADRDPRCGFDHALWHVDPVTESPTHLTIGRAIRAAAGERGLCPGWTLRVEGLPFARRQYCQKCRTASPDSIHVAARISEAKRRCPVCKEEMIVRDDDALAAIELGKLKRDERRRTLHSMGLRHADVYSVHGPHGACHFELARQVHTVQI